MMIYMKLLCNLVLLLLLQERIVYGNINTTIRGSLNFQRNAQQVLDSDSCYTVITGYSTYNTSTNQFDKMELNYVDSSYSWPGRSRVQARILLDKYPSRKINIIVNTNSCPSNPIQCVKIKLGDFQTTYEKSPPYALYGDNTITGGVVNVKRPQKNGWQPLEVWTYSDPNCLGKENKYDRIDVQLVPKTIASTNVGPLPVIYNGTISSSVTTQQTAAMVKATCDSIYKSFDILFYRDSTRVEKFRCWRVNNTTGNTTGSTITTLSPPLSITYKVVVTFRMDRLYPFSYNLDLPNNTVLTDYFKSLFRDVSPTGFGEYMSEYIKGTIKSSSPYYSYTNIIV